MKAEMAKGEPALVFSFGVLLHFCLYGVTPSELTTSPPRPRAEYKDYVSLMQQCLAVDPAKRPTIFAVLHDPFFNMLIIPQRKSLAPYKIIKETYAIGSRTYTIAEKKGSKKRYNMISFRQDQLTEREKGEMEHKTMSMRVLVGCKNVLKLYESFSCEGKVYLVFEDFQTDLDSFLSERVNSKRYLTPTEQRSIAYQLIVAINETHTHNLIHRNVTPTSIFIREDAKSHQSLRVKLAGFELAKLMPEIETGQSAILTTFHSYLAPEAAKPTNPITQMMDIFSYGLVVFYVLYGREVPYVTKSSEPVPVPSFPFDQELVPLIERCFAALPQDRPTAAELVAHPIFDAFHHP